MDAFSSAVVKGRRFEHLTSEQIDSFFRYGYLRIPQCFSTKQAEEWTKDVWTRLGFDPKDPETWTTERTNMPRHNSVKVAEFAPKAFHAMCELAGGEERVTDRSKEWYDSFIVNLGSKEFEGKEVNPKELPGWHVDGDFFVHFLDSPEQGLLVIPLFTDVLPHGGGTVVCPAGIDQVARWLVSSVLWSAAHAHMAQHDHPNGVMPRMSPIEDPQRWESGLQWYSDAVQGMPDHAFHEMTGSAGDVILLHPLMLHSASRNARRLPRIITNPPVALRQPFDFDRANPSDYSLVELKTIQTLGGQQATRGWKMTGTRAEVVPERIRKQAQMVEEEKRRLAETSQQSSTVKGVQTVRSVA